MKQPRNETKVQLRVLHIDDELPHIQGIWNYFRHSLLLSIPSELRSKVSIHNVCSRVGVCNVLEIVWPFDSKMFSLVVGTFTDVCGETAQKFIKECTAGQTFVILDVIDQTTGAEILERSIMGVRDLITETISQFRIYSAFSEDFKDRIRLDQNNTENSIVHIPADWELAGADGLQLDDIIMSKTQATELGKQMLYWIHSMDCL